MRCLIIDDDESPRRLLTQIVERSGHFAVAVPDGRAGLVMATRESFDIAIVDLELPGQTGSETITALRTMCPHTRVLVVSGFDDRRHVLEALEAGADGYLVKDEIADSLMSSLQSVRAGFTPLSPRVAAIMLRQLRKSLDRPPVQTDTVGRVGVRKPERPNREPDRDLAEGTGPVPCLPDKKPVSE